MIKHEYPADCTTPEQKKRHRAMVRRQGGTSSSNTTISNHTPPTATRKEKGKSKRQAMMAVQPSGATTKPLERDSKDWRATDLPPEDREVIDDTMSMTDINRALRGWGKPFCPTCGKAVYPWAEAYDSKLQCPIHPTCRGTVT
jgi:hypothetical protein